MNDNLTEAEQDRRVAMGFPGKPDENAIHYNSKLVGVTFVYSISVFTP